MATTRKTAPPPDVQLIANAVITDGRGRVLLTRYGDDGDDAWWLPGAELRPYEHPDEAVLRALDGLAGTVKRRALHHVESFRGRRGWHVMFNYLVTIGTRSAGEDGEWFAANELPRLSHGRWERGVIEKALGGPAAGPPHAHSL
jgi:ADP-ribose pyrophosphatase YjhB (NUDIX family)